MKLLADENIPAGIVERLRSHGHDVVCGRSAHPGAKDLDLLNKAEDGGRVLLTLDRDFWQLALQRRPALERAGVILLRIHPATTSNLWAVLQGPLEADYPWSGHIAVLSREGVQMVPTRPR